MERPTQPAPVDDDMQPPPIQYVVTSDGVRIAYSPFGRGPVVIQVDLPNTNIEFAWRVPEIRRTRRATGSFLNLVRYDPRGFGMSERDIDNFSLEEMVRDIEAVVAAQTTREFSLVAETVATPIAVAYAAQRPRGLARLVLWDGAARGLDLFDQRLLSLVEAAGDDWELASESFMHAIQGWLEDVAARRSAALLREAVTQQMFLKFMHQAKVWDVTGRLSDIHVPTLVLQAGHRPDTSDTPGQFMASRIPNSQLVFTHGPHEERFRTALLAIGRFLLGDSFSEARFMAENRSSISDADTQPRHASPRTGEHDVFISYADEDKVTANAVCAKLEGGATLCWIAPRDIEPGFNWPAAIVEAVASSKAMVLVYSGFAGASESVMREVQLATDHGVTIVPFRIENVPLTDFFKFHMANKHWLDALTPPLEHHLETLQSTISRLIPNVEERGQEAP